MSSTFTPITQATYDYWMALLKPEDELLHELNRDAAAAGIPPISVAPDQGLVLTWLMKMTNAKLVLEIGTLAGYSAICLARGMGEEGRLVTCEFLPLHADFAERQFAKAGLAKQIRLLRGPALDHLPRLPDGTYDFVFIDADKDNYPNYLEHAVRLLKPGGMVCADNANAFGLIAEKNLDPNSPDTPRVEMLRKFNKLLAGHPQLEPVWLSVGDGMFMGRKKN